MRIMSGGSGRRGGHRRAALLLVGLLVGPCPGVVAEVRDGDLNGENGPCLRRIGARSARCPSGSDPRSPVVPERPRRRSANVRPRYGFRDLRSPLKCRSASSLVNA